MTEAAVVPWWRRLTPYHLVYLLPWVGIVIGASKSLADNSFLWHVRAGTTQLDLGSVLRTDPFSFTMEGAKWRTQSWLAELLYGQLERWSGGLGWVPLLLILCSGLTLVLVALAVRHRSEGSLLNGLVMAGLTILALSFEVPRPVVFSFLFLALTVVVLQLEMRWAVPILIWIWASVHGSWIIGLGYIALESLASARPTRQALRDLGASIISVNLTAHGLGVWSVLLAFFRNRAALDLMSEWRIPDITSPVVMPYTLGVIVLFVGAASGRFKLRDLWIVVPFALFGLTAGRSLMPAAVVLTPWVAQAAKWKSGLPPRSLPRREAAVNSLIGAVLVLAPLSALLVNQPVLDAVRFPVAASKSLSSGALWHDDAVGGYLIYSLWPSRKVYVDDRAELFGAEFMSRFVRSREGVPIWRDVFAEFAIQQALTRRGDGLSQALATAGWSVSFEDSNWLLWSRPSRSSTVERSE